MDMVLGSMFKVSFKSYDENLENIYKFMHPLWYEVYKDIIFGTIEKLKTRK